MVCSIDEYYVDEIDWRRIVIFPDGLVDMFKKHVDSFEAWLRMEAHGRP